MSRSANAELRKDPYAIERELRQRLTVMEYRILQARLTGAVKAIATLRQRAPDLMPAMFGDPMQRAKVLAPHTQAALAMLVEELLAVAATDTRGRVDRRRLLRLISRRHL